MSDGNKIFHWELETVKPIFLVSVLVHQHALRMDLF